MSVTPTSADCVKVSRDPESKEPWSGLVWQLKFQYTVHTRKTSKTVCLHGELVDGFFGLGGVESVQHSLHGCIVLELDDIFASGIAEGLLDFNRSGGRHAGLQAVCWIRRSSEDGSWVAIWQLDREPL